MKFFRPLDIIIIGVIIAAGVFFWGRQSNQKGARAEVYIGNDKVAGFNLNGEEQEAEISSGIGKITIRYGNGAINVAHSPCKQQICVLQGEIHHTHEQIICVPAKMRIIVVESQPIGSGQEIDAVSY